MEKKLKKSILITGCSSGIGEALVKRFISEGFLVFGSCQQTKGKCTKRWQDPKNQKTKREMHKTLAGSKKPKNQSF